MMTTALPAEGKSNTSSGHYMIRVHAFCTAGDPEHDTGAYCYSYLAFFG